jgi:choline dehydrogenase-like flavoprotein
MALPADVCIIGAGASGATAARVLAEGGLRLVVLERGPWLRPEDFLSDELGTVNREFLRPDPALDPRTVRASADEQAHPASFCPVPQMVGGGTVHWTGWVPRFTADDFRQRSLHGDVAGASLADWPVGYADMEPYYDHVEWGLGVSGRAGANRYESPRSRGYPCPPLPPAPYAKRFRRGCAALGLNWFPTPVALRSRPQGGRPAAVLHSFLERHGDPTGTKSTALTTFIPDALATGRVEIRPECYVRELVRDAVGRVRAAVYQDANGRWREQRAELFLLACGAIETARLWHLSQLPDTNDLVGRNLTLHEYAGAIGLFEEPVYGWAGGGHLGASTFEFYGSDPGRGFIGGGHVVCSGARLPWPINHTLPGRALWGAAMKQADRDTFNHTMSVGIVLGDLPRHTNRVDLDPSVCDAWGVPVARITHAAHPNDLAQGRFLVDRCADILEAAGARRVWRFPIERITGNASHQHGTTRMGYDQGSSVLDRSCRAHEVPNLYVVDGGGFPTPAGNNPTLTIMANAWRVADAILARQR